MKSGVKSNVWLKRIASVFSLIYAIYICILSFRSVFYDVIIKKPLVFCLYLSVVSAAALVVMIYSRKQLATKLASFVMIPALLPIIIMCLGSWEMIIPLAICAVTIFFASGANEGTKTLLGTLYLLVYILAALAYFIFTSYLASPAVKKTVDEGVSPSEKYRYEVITTTDSSGGCTTVMLEPNYMDINRSSVTYKVRGYNRKLCVKRPLTEVKIEWKEDDLYINGEQAKKGKWFEKESFSLDFM